MVRKAKKTIKNESKKESKKGSKDLTVKEYLGLQVEEEIEIKPNFIETKEKESKSEYIETDQIPQKDVRTVTVGGFFGRKYSVKKVGDKLIYEKAPQKKITQSKPKMEDSFGDTIWEPAVTKRGKPNDNSVIKFCSVCGNPVKTRGQKICGQCGSELK